MTRMKRLFSISARRAGTGRITILWCDSEKRSTTSPVAQDRTEDPSRNRRKEADMGGADHRTKGVSSRIVPRMMMKDTADKRSFRKGGRRKAMGKTQ